MATFDLVPFHGDMLQATRDESGVWVALRPMCDALGVAEQRQASKHAYPVDTPKE